MVIVAEDGMISSNPDEGLINMTMNNGVIHTYNNNTSSEITFSKYELVLTAEIDQEKIKPEEILTGKLWKGRKRIPWAIELHRRLALPFACIIFGILGPALSNRMGKIGRLGGLSMSLCDPYILLSASYCRRVFCKDREDTGLSGRLGP